MVLTREWCLKLYSTSLVKMFCSHRQHDIHGKIESEKKATLAVKLLHVSLIGRPYHIHKAFVNFSDLEKTSAADIMLGDVVGILGVSCVLLLMFTNRRI